MKTISLSIALLMAMRGARAQDTAVYRPSIAEQWRPAKYILFQAPFNGMPVGSTFWLGATVYDSVSNQYHPVIHWRSSDTTVATVAATGEANVPLFGRRAGRTVITAFTDSLSKSAIVYVGRVPPVARLDIVPKRATIGVGESIRFLPVLRDARGRAMPPGALLWSWSDTTVVLFNGGTTESELLLQGRRDGEITIFADAGRRTARATLVVGAGGRSPPVRSIVLLPSDTSVRVGDEIEFTASLLGDGGVPLAGRLVRWSVCDTTILRRWTFIPMQSAHITYRAMRAGTCRVTATADGVRRTARVVISNPL